MERSQGGSWRIRDGAVSPADEEDNDEREPEQAETANTSRLTLPNGESDSPLMLLFAKDSEHSFMCVLKPRGLPVRALRTVYRCEMKNANRLS